MLFSSPEFLIFFFVLIGILLLSRSNRLKKALLLGASYFFYGYWDYRFTLLMVSMTVVNYYVGVKIGQTQNPQKKRWLFIGIVFNLTILGFFKYFNFFTNSFNSVFNTFNINLSTLDIILPIGISFITFEVISYIVDIYRGTISSAKNIWDFALLVAFFPHLIAGPILRPNQFLPEINKPIQLNLNNFSCGIQLFLLGLVRKVVIADSLAMFVDSVFKHPIDYSSTTVWLAIFAYAIQIYCDFCGYSDMAIGVARILGFDIPINFDLPYISRSITEFWRRWHISLSSWLRDYLYIPLGGNRLGKLRQYLNLMIVMLLGGLWHGASWNFFCWGGLHGSALAIHKLYSDSVLKESREKETSWLYQLGSTIVTFLFICLTWIFFRSSDFSTSTLMLQKLFLLSDPNGVNWYPTALVVSFPILILCDCVAKILYQGRMLNLNSFRGLAIFFFVLFGVFFLSPSNPSPFIYFQF
jgi:alginate O-acetyltransferase complex protein AlgI